MSETGTKTPRGLTAVLFTCIAAAAAGVLLTPPPAGGAIVPAPHREVRACAATEDSYLTDCHGHRLAYSGGKWYVPQHPAGRHLPEWFRAERIHGHPNCLRTGDDGWLSIS